MNTAPYLLVRDVPGAHRIASDLWLLRGRPRHLFNAYVMGDVLVDARTRHAARSILRQIRDLPLSAHALTHAHMDHMGSSHELCETLGLPLMCGEADVVAAESGGRKGLAERPWPRRLQHRLMAGPGHPVDQTLSEGDEIAGFVVFEVPGHSPGHLAFWREQDRLLVLGDVLFNLRLPTGRPGLQLPPLALTADPVTNLASARRLGALRPEIVCFGHGPPLRDGDRFQRFVADAMVRNH
jgi:hydroxyacylglutathione hydrolase